MFRCYRVNDYEDMSRKAADIVSAQVIMEPSCVLGLATGSTPQGLYRQLVERYRNGELDFAEVRTVNLDEYQGLDRANPQSYYAYMQENLFQYINIHPANVHLPDGLAGDADAECERYNNIIRSLGGIDLQVLGIGDNGHIGFNEPGEAFKKGTHRVALTESTIQANARFFTSAAEVPRYAFSMGIQSIMQARRIVMVAGGAKKADALYNAFFGPITPALPASILQLHDNVTVVADTDAMKQFL